MKIYNKETESYIDLEVHSQNCLGVFRGQNIHGRIVEKSRGDLTIVWKHVDPYVVEEYEKTPDGFYARKNKVPAVQFDPTTYKILNPDLWKMNDTQLKEHYSMFGLSENRKIQPDTSLNLKCPTEKTRQPIFINHESSLTGAPIFLYDLVSYLKESGIFSDPIIAEPYPNDLFKSYKLNKLYYYNDPALLYSIISSLDPVMIYSNSINMLFLEIDIFEEFLKKTIFHFHESIENVNKESLFKIKDKKIFVVAEKIKKQFEAHGCHNVSVFPPFLPRKKIVKIDNSRLSLVPAQLKNGFRTIDLRKVIVGMSGSISERKGFSLFYETAKINSDKDFVWIGGPDQWIDEASSIYNRDFVEQPNFFHVSYTKNPYMYFDLLDCLFLTSINDPCPIVALESMYLGTRIVAIKGNIFYSHEDSNLGDAYTLLEPGTDKEITEEFSKLKLSKGKMDIGKQHIIKNFFFPLILKNDDVDGCMIVDYKPDDEDGRSVDHFIDSINFFNIKNKLKYCVFVNLYCEENDLIKKIKMGVLNLKKILFPAKPGIKAFAQAFKCIDNNDEIKKIGYCCLCKDSLMYDLFNYEFEEFYNSISLKSLISSKTVFDDPVLDPLAFITMKRNIKISSINESCEKSMCEIVGKMISKNGLLLF